MVCELLVEDPLQMRRSHAISHVAVRIVGEEVLPLSGKSSLFEQKDSDLNEPHQVQK